MACGLPVICSNAGSLPEIAGNAAILVDPDDIDAISAKILEVLSNENLARQMSEKGLRQAARFTWVDTARQTLAVYEELGTAT